MTKSLLSNSIKIFVIAAICLILGIGQIFAQTQGTGQITGTASDPTGAVVPNANVTLVNKATNATQTSTTSDEGIYKFVLLQPGTYSVKVASSGFSEQTLDVEVQVGRTTDANFTLGAAGTSAEVTVTAEGVQTTTVQSDAVLNQTAINNLPINGRRFQDFVTLTPTAQVEPSRGQISLSGQRGINSNINVDGVDFNQPFFGGIRGGERSNLAFTVPQESIREFQVVAAGYNAEFGRSTGGIVNAVTKSGDNNFHGSLFYLLRPSKLARGNEYTQALQQQKLSAAGVNATLAPTQQQFGGSIGGKIVKDKLFYFFAYEQQRFRAPRQIVFGISTAFPGTTVLTAGQTDVLNFYRGIQTGYQLTNDAYAPLGRVDWNINDSNRFNFRYNFSKNTAANAVSRGETSLDPTTTQALSTNGTEGDKNNAGVAQLITNFGSNIINDLHLQYAREDRPRLSNSNIPQVLTGFATLGATAFLPTTQYDTRKQITDSVTFLTGNHTFKFGGEYSRLFATQTFGFNQFGAYALSIGSTDANVLTTLTGLSNNPGVAGALGRFDNTSARYNRQIGNLQAAFNVQEAALYAQDAWRITPKLTVNYGLRIEQQYNPTPEANNTQIINVVKNTIFPIRGKGYDPTQIPDSGWQVGPRLGFAYDPNGDGKTVIRGYTGLYYARTPLLLFASSVNNYRLPPGDVSTTLGAFNTSSQAAFNTFLGTAASSSYKSITGCNSTVTPQQAACVPNTLFRQFAIIGVNLNNSNLDNLPVLSLDQISSINSALGLSPNAFTNAQVTGHSEDFKNPMSFQYGFAIERQVFKNMVIGIDFSHVKTTRLQRNRDLNLPAPLTAEQYISFLQTNNTTANFNTMVSNGTIDLIRASGRTFIAVNTPTGLTFPTGSTTTRPRPTAVQQGFTLGAVQVRESTAKSLYDEVTLRMRWVRRWGQINAYYTLSRNLSDDDNERDSGGSAFANPYDVSTEYGYSRLDRRHQFVANPVVFLPFGVELSSAIRFRSGTPLNSTVGSDLNGDGVNNDRPISATGVVIKRDSFRNQAIYDVDFRAQEAVKLGESRRLIFSAEFFNVLNRANIIFPSPNANASSGAPLQFCSAASQVCGLNGIPTNVNFRQIRDQVSGSSTFGQILVNNVSPGSQVFQIQLGVRFQF